MTAASPFHVAAQRLRAEDARHGPRRPRVPDEVTNHPEVEYEHREIEEEATEMEASQPEQTSPPVPAEQATGPAPARRVRRDGRPDLRYAAHGSGGRRKSSKRAPVKAVEAHESPTVAKLLAQVDHEMAALQRARDALLQA